MRPAKFGPAANLGARFLELLMVTWSICFCVHCANFVMNAYLEHCVRPLGVLMKTSHSFF